MPSNPEDGGGTPPSPVEVIQLRGAREHNLARLDLDLPKNRWIAVTGPSGSGKTSLVFSTLVREGERRFLGSLSGKARQFFGKLGRSEVDSLRGLPPTIAIGEKATSPNVRSTVGTLTGTLDLLRLVFARAGRDSEGTRLTRSHFSFNHPLGQCPNCRGLGLEDRVDPKKIVLDPTKSIRDGALLPTLKNGYTVYSQVTLEVMDRICQAHGFDVNRPWNTLSSKQQDVIFYGTRALKVPFGKHSIESRMKWEGITARPREEGYYLGLVPVIEETLKRNRNENILRFVRTARCRECEGTRLAEPGRDARFGAYTLPRLLAVSAADWAKETGDFPQDPVWVRVRPALEERISRLVHLGLGHLSLDRSSTSLSGGEAQRVRLAAQLGAGLSDVLFALDEPTLGLHPESQAGLETVLHGLISQGNSLIVVEHDPDMVRYADHVVALGPEAGALGGQVVRTDWPGHPASHDRQDHPLGGPPVRKSCPRSGRGRLILSGATLYNLDHTTLRLDLGAFNVIVGPSGAGKSSLVFGTLLPALQQVEGGPYQSMEFEDSEAGEPVSPNAARIGAVDARPIGKTPRSTPATWSGLFEIVRRLFAKSEAARAAGLTASHFSFNSPRGRCESCQGLGVTRLGLHLFEDVELVCETCEGSRYAPQVLEARLRDKTIAEVLALTFREAEVFFESHKDAASLCAAMVTLGLGYLTLGQSSGSLSRGEAQRIKLGTLLGSKRRERSIVLLDEPDRGLAPTDIAMLLHALDAMVDAGHTIVAISHHRHLWAAADQLIEVREGRTDHDPVIDWDVLSTRKAVPTRTDAENPSRPIELRGVQTHNLRDIDVDFPRHKLTAVEGVSGSGKSSLVFDTLCAEAEGRFAESLPFQVRRFIRRLPKPQFTRAHGLTPTLSLRQESGRVSARSTVATQSECGPLLRLLFARAGLYRGELCRLSASHFSSERALGACSECSGRGTRQKCDPTKLLTDPAAPLLSSSDGTNAFGAMGGTRPGRYFTEHDGQYMATLISALLEERERTEVPHTDPIGREEKTAELFRLLSETPWQNLPEEVRRIALFGSGPAQLKVKWSFSSQVEGEGHHEFTGTWDGLCALVEREADNRVRSKKAAEWAAPLGPIPCSICHGSGLTTVARAVTLLGHTLPALLDLPLDQIMPTLGWLTGPRHDPASANPAVPPTGKAEGAVLDALLPELAERLDELVALGLGHLSLKRSTLTLSSGELQRVRLAGALRSGLSGITLVLDEPTAGLHERDVLSLLDRLRRFQAEGNTIVAVSHRPSLIRSADHAIKLGPGAGDKGGHVVDEGPPRQRRSSHSLYSCEDKRLPPAHWIRIEGARAHNLRNINIEVPVSGFVCITGVSGSGKSSLTFDVLGASVAERRTVAADSVHVPGGFEHFVEVYDARKAGKGRNALAALDIANEVAALFAGGAGIRQRAFKQNDPTGRCPTCAGAGRERVAMDFLADLDLPCQACHGSGFRPEILEVRWRGVNIAELLAEPSTALLERLHLLTPGEQPKGHSKLVKALEALAEVAAGHIPLGRPRTELSGGESARLTLAANLLDSPSPALYLFDEPSTGLHESDLAQILTAFRRLAERGNLIVATEHRISAVAAADWVIDLGPGGGPNGGLLVEAGPPDTLRRGDTAAAIRREFHSTGH